MDTKPIYSSKTIIVAVLLIAVNALEQISASLGTPLVTDESKKLALEWGAYVIPTLMIALRLITNQAVSTTKK
ncbi:MAG: hypothetical protein KKD77_20700 [Gammaproteobacteria bacterium]|nr:hypothetical protein [Gammaproteobacteria bacterium]